MQPTATSLSIDRSLLRPCAKLPLLGNGGMVTRLHFSKLVITMYGDCRRKHQALIDSVNTMNRRGKKNEAR
ncbi:hypothetical protein [Veronia pacifica]|uniref:hypothetical protein n=1 Tax=Veronia pacifica TaxID=1080227 RepID=UPI0015868C3A|nr:hypothetical protein [Veronia pacifica]